MGFRQNQKLQILLHFSLIFRIPWGIKKNFGQKLVQHLTNIFTLLLAIFWKLKINPAAFQSQEQKELFKWNKTHFFQFQKCSFIDLKTKQQKYIGQSLRACWRMVFAHMDKVFYLCKINAWAQDKIAEAPCSKLFWKNYIRCDNTQLRDYWLEKWQFFT